MNYTSSRYDGPYGPLQHHQGLRNASTPGTGSGGSASGSGQQTHSASSSLSVSLSPLAAGAGAGSESEYANGSMNHEPRDSVNMAGIGANSSLHLNRHHPHNHHHQQQQQYSNNHHAQDSGGSSGGHAGDQLDPPSSTTRLVPGNGVVGSAGGSSSSRLGRNPLNLQPVATPPFQQHTRAQHSDDYERMLLGVAPYSVQPATPSRAEYFDERDLRDARDRDASFDFLLSPGLAPVGPISSAASSTSSNNNNPAAGHIAGTSNAALLQTNGSGDTGHGYGGANASLFPLRPGFSRSQTALPAMTAYGAAKGINAGPTFQQQSSGAYFAPMHSDASQAGPLPTVSAGNLQPQTASTQPPSQTGSINNDRQVNGNGQHVPPPAISASALLEVVLKMRNDAQPSPQMLGLGSSSAASGSSAMMGRSQSSNAAVRLQQPGFSQPAYHNRNISNGSVKSDDEQPSVAQQQQPNGAVENGQSFGNSLLLPPHPGMTRTASSKSVTAPAPTGTGLETVDLSHQRIAEVPEEVIDVLAGSVTRLALSYNYISVLPPAFAKLGGTLRYLNIRLNMLTTFPPVLCEMPSLEILDISRNKIKRLPSNCGTLRGLRVFSISKNRVKRLPSYIADMPYLRVLKIDHNPLEWPPREIVTQPNIPANNQSGGRKESDAAARLDEAQALQRWLTNLQEWIREHSTVEAAASAQPSLGGSRSQDMLADIATETQRVKASDFAGPSEAGRPDDHPDQSGRVNAVQATPQDTDDAIPSPGSAAYPQKPSDLPPLEVDPSRMSQHGRNASHSLAAGVTQKRSLRVKKSLPDLRQNHAKILDDRFNDGADTSLTPTDEPQPSLPSPRPRLLPLHAKQASITSFSTGTPSPVSARSPAAGLPTPPRSASGDRPRPFSPARQPELAGSNGSRKREDDLTPLRDFGGNQRRNFNPNLTNAALPGASLERGSSGAYFRRLSMLPAFTVSKAVPSSLLDFVDGIRGILFSLSQIFSSLKQFVVFPAPDRLPSPFVRMMASADDAMGFLIDALDRFDASSRRQSLEPSVVKEVVETCRENVAIFGKLVTVILSQMGSLFSSASDVRYSRTLTVALYGAMGEIALSWASLTPLKDEIAVWLQGDVVSPFSNNNNNSNKPSLLSESVVEEEDDDDDESLASQATQRPGLPTGSAIAPVGLQRGAMAGKARRHAGSFTKYAGPRNDA